MKFTVEYSAKAIADFQKHKKSGQKILLKRIENFVIECVREPRSGTGKPEQLKHFEIETWSRKINNQHRFVYRIEDDLVFVLSAWGHYEDK